MNDDRYWAMRFAPLCRPYGPSLFHVSALSRGCRYRKEQPMTAISRNRDDIMPWEDEQPSRRKGGPSIVGELDPDVMDCGEPEATWKEMVRHLRWRASNSRSLAFDCEQTAKDAAENAELFAAQATDFAALADALERANVTFPALAAGSRRAKTPKAVECEASQSGGDSRNAPEQPR